MAGIDSIPSYLIQYIFANDASSESLQWLTPLILWNKEIIRSGEEIDHEERMINLERQLLDERATALVKRRAALVDEHARFLLALESAERASVNVALATRHRQNTVSPNTPNEDSTKPC
jgi:hypothetical protein